MIRFSGYVFALVCSGIDFAVTHFTKPGFPGPRFYNPRHPVMDDAWRRIKEHPTSFPRDWVNVATGYTESPRQEHASKPTGFIMIFLNVVSFLARGGVG